MVLTARLRMDRVDNAITKPVHRLEVFTGAGRRRSFSDEDKTRIVAEIATSGESVCAVARRHGLSPQQLFGWRRRLRESQVGSSEADRLQFVPAVVDAGSSAVPQRRAPRCKTAANSPARVMSAPGRRATRPVVPPSRLSSPAHVSFGSEVGARSRDGCFAPNNGHRH